MSSKAVRVVSLDYKPKHFELKGPETFPADLAKFAGLFFGEAVFAVIA